ncbi:hypothetical protein [Krasilnikovia sp. M28-CT-15]|uniref:hypothetical protein n=1 Tax=Krasilnikovia sp. M28-CT-15 TaxID=3373540 RepID=UPI003876CA56
MIELTSAGRRVRLACTLAVVLLVLAGTFWGQDDDFPFGPFRMYSTAPGPDDAARDTRVEGQDTTGRTIVLTEANTGIRRAEIEGQQQAYMADPARMSRIATAYLQHTPGAAPLRRVQIVVRWHGVRDSRPTGTYRDEIIANWSQP